MLWAVGSMVPYVTEEALSEDPKEQVDVLNTPLMSLLCHHQVAARTGETGVRRRTQAMSRSASKRRSRFSSLWGLDTTSKKKQGRPSINQVDSRVGGKGSLQGGCVSVVWCGVFLY